MAGSQVPEPWRLFLADIDAAAPEVLALHCLGGFAVSVYYGMSRATGDLDVIEVPHDAAKWLEDVAGKGSPLHRQHRLYVQVVTISTVPDSYADRLVEIFPDDFNRLRLFVLDPYDLALSKLSRNLELDLEDVKHLARTCDLDLELLETRYHEELRHRLVGPVERHDLTIRLWLDAIREDRRR